MQEQLMSPPNITWRDIIGQATQSPDVLKQPEVIKNVQNILQTNVSVCSSLGHPFLPQLSKIYLDMLNAYRYKHSAEYHNVVHEVVIHLRTNFIKIHDDCFT